MDRAKYQELLAKYLKGECSDEERAVLDQWYASLDSNVDLPATDSEKQGLLGRNWQSLADRTIRDRPAVPMHQRFRLRPYWAAAVVLLVGCGLGWYLTRPSGSEILAQRESVLESQTTVLERINRSTQPERLVLSDQSVVTLQPGSTLRYPATFASEKREVTLIGEAFFEVEKNPHQPFLVYSHDLITKVLGTSFRIKANPGDRNVQVAVQTGRVSVYSPKLVTENRVKSDPETIGVVLTPNQQVTYLDQEHRLVKTLVEKPAILVQPKQVPTFTFQNAPVADLITAIEKTYGVDVMYDEELMANCYITTSLDQENLYDKLTIMCKLLGATYKIIDAQIVISGPGCP
ncbi:FecR family protein [Larkinella arboricola]|uniref:FecR family protein n=1 Tax=Larkinella arboricola TaxID=643671 RepID=A0A327X8L0_LARAB|nr:FecR family protein [Larkinella arboricola]RAK01992.1 FecR family protein [Larkinella arboricola]